jgi:predicted nucleotidyltransferase
MESSHGKNAEAAAGNVILVIESARDLVRDIKDLSRRLDDELKESSDIDSIVCLLQEKRSRVDMLRQMATQIRTELRVGGDGKPAVEMPEVMKLELGDLVVELRQLLDEEARIEALICGTGLPIAGRLR